LSDKQFFIFKKSILETPPCLKHIVLETLPRVETRNQMLKYVCNKWANPRSLPKSFWNPFEDLREAVSTFFTRF